ncbi:hypothetical protein AKJ52_00745 [candidate division MSBL1 archaeon SCGC-AAA382C18]|uniref:DUF4258 domain-containing protein n=1 Tax=candidate division MSBL1 archaeon SCGC-AAA382C18 TaxID=1698281 RepID=A0A133VL60_9EURY|nr:hypothetical protein AKJ52_00745 [candidate division MSBL1 archaeon SCGC-AAA382C18]
MKIVFSDHSLERLKQRNISRRKIREILKNPDETRNGKYGRKIAHRYENDKLIRIIYIKKGENRYVIITAYKTDPDRYGDKKWK